MINDDDLHSSSPKNGSPCEFQKHLERQGSRTQLSRFVVSVQLDTGATNEYVIEATDLPHAITVALKREHEKGYDRILAGLLAQRDIV